MLVWRWTMTCVLGGGEEEHVCVVVCSREHVMVVNGYVCVVVDSGVHVCDGGQWHVCVMVVDSDVCGGEQWHVGLIHTLWVQMWRWGWSDGSLVEWKVGASSRICGLGDLS